VRLRFVLLNVGAVLLGLAIVVVPALVASPDVAHAPVIEAAAEQVAPVTEPPATPTPTLTGRPGPGNALAPNPEAASPSTVGQRLAARVTVTTVNAGATIGVAVLDADGDPVYGFDEDAAMLPASTQKLFVAAAALNRLGPEFRFRTEVAGTGPIVDGVLQGDLVLLGSIDPVLATPSFAQHVNPQRPRTPLEALADQVAAAGVTHIAGGVLGDPSVLPHQPEAPGWLPRYLTSGNTTRSSGLTVDAGRRLFVERGRWQSAPSADPAAEAAASLASLLAERDVTLGGGVGATPGSPADAQVLGTVQSPPLHDLLRHMVQRSDNHLADALFRAVGRADGDGSWASAAKGTRAALAPLGLDLSAGVLADGSGLSRDDRSTARTLVELDQRMTRSQHGPLWRSLMAVSGESGTLRRRLVGTVAERRVLGKTGSLTGVRTLSGTVEGPEGARYHFAVLGNGLDPSGDEALRALQDDIVLALTEDLYDCVRVLVPVPPDELADPQPSEPSEPDVTPTPAPTPAPEPTPEMRLELVCAS
jgi:D-alanyl-D-alanine carboxypeptidase/D-alanyl-D-alanine-endopeptidase (penicillin-binding protein 4)